MFSPEMIIDVQQLKEAAWGDPEVVLDLVDAFEDEYPHMRVALDLACSNLDSTEMQRAAHTLKGALLVLGARCSTLADLLEQSSASTRPAEMAAVANELILQASQVGPALRLLIATGEL